MLKWITDVIGIGKNPFTSWTVWGLIIWQASVAIAGVLCGDGEMRLPAAWCGTADQVIASLKRDKMGPRNHRC